MSEGFDVEAVRSRFPAASRLLYLDAAHQTPLSTSVRAGVDRFLDEALETAGPKRVWLARINGVRAKVACLLNAQSEEIAFVKNTSEGLNIAAHALPLSAGDNVLMIEGDHPNNAYAFLNLGSRGVEVRFVPQRSDRAASAATFAAHIDARTRAISLSHVTFHAGQRNDVASVGRLCRERGLHLVVDAMQSVGVMPVDVEALGVTMLAAGCHKGLLTPQGLGLLYVRGGVEGLVPAYLANASLDNPPDDLIARKEAMKLARGAARFEYGNYNLPALHGLDAALDLIGEVGVPNISRHVLDLGDRLIAHLDRLGIALVGPRAREERSHIYVLPLFAGWAEFFESRNVRVTPERDGIRVSFGLFNTSADVDRFAEILAEGQRIVGSTVPRAHAAARA